MVTVLAALPLIPSLVAVIVALPAATLVTSPLLLTVATLGLLEVHVTERPVRTRPPASLSTALSCFIAPTDRFTVAGLTVTDATGAGPTPVAAVVTRMLSTKRA